MSPQTHATIIAVLAHTTIVVFLLSTSRAAKKAGRAKLARSERKAAMLFAAIGLAAVLTIWTLGSYALSTGGQVDRILAIALLFGPTLISVFCGFSLTRHATPSANSSGGSEEAKES